MAFSILRDKLISRGYWDEAGSGDGEGGVGGTPPVDPPVVPPADPAKPSDSEARLLKESMARKAKIAEKEAEIQTLKEQLDKFSGVDLDEVKLLIETKKNAQIKELEDKQQWEALKTQMRDENAKVVKETLDKFNALQDVTAKQQAIIDKLTLGNSFNTSAFILNELNLSPEKTKIIYGGHFDIEGDRAVAYDKPKGTEGRVQLVNADGDALSFEDAIKKIVDADPDKALLLKTKKKEGSGSSSLGLAAKMPPQAQPKGLGRIEKALNDKK